MNVQMQLYAINKSKKEKENKTKPQTILPKMGIDNLTLLYCG